MDRDHARAQLRHEPVLAQEVLELLGPVLAAGRVVDATVGLGGHARLLAQAAGPQGSLLGLDRDPQALEIARERLQGAACPVRLELGRLGELDETLQELGFTPVSAVLADLGVSSMQLETPERGFSFQAEGPLDMRMGPDVRRTAADIVQDAPESELAQIFRDYGEERYARRIAAAVVRVRKQRPLRTTSELASLIRSTIGKRESDSRIHPATRVFQALRIAVNDELGQIEPMLEAALAHTRPGGRIAVISFHSLEDRIVKTRVRYWAAHCLCPPRQPVCNCGKKPSVRILTRKALQAGEEELARNPRSRSARLRAVEKLEEAGDAY
jgi:16S rRNA (cytosine1402-N4)-methyltransferase